MATVRTVDDSQLLVCNHPNMIDTSYQLTVKVKQAIALGCKEGTFFDKDCNGNTRKYMFIIGAHTFYRELDLMPDGDRNYRDTITYAGIISDNQKGDETVFGYLYHTSRILKYYSLRNMLTSYISCCSKCPCELTPRMLLTTEYAITLYALEITEGTSNNYRMCL